MAIYQPYFYIIQDKRNGMYYAGAKWAKDSDPSNFMIEGGYTTSSNTINELVRQHGLGIFIIRKVKIFNTAEETNEYETKFLRKVDARNNPRFYNGHNNDGYMDLSKMKSIMLELHGVEYPMQSKMIRQKSKSTLIKNYGVESPMLSEEIKKRVIETNLSRRGVEHPTQSVEVKETIRKNNLAKYGVENVFQTEWAKQKSRDTMMKNYGVEYAAHSLELTEKKRKNNIEKYGVPNPAMLDSVKQKSKSTKQQRYGNHAYNNIEQIVATNQSRYGGPAPACDPLVREKMSSTCLEKYGVEHYAKTEEYRERNREIKRSKASRPQVSAIKYYVERFGARLNRGWYQSSDDKLDAILLELKSTYGSVDD